MTRQVFPWARFWYEEDLDLPNMDGGYLADPESEYGKYLARGLLRLAELPDDPLVVLLGESGMGKSTEIELAAGEHPSGGTTGRPARLDLATVASEESLRRAIDEVVGLPQPDGEGDLPVTVYLDSLDECALGFAQVVAILPRVLGSLLGRGVRNRLACRSGAWPRSLGQEIRKQLGIEPRFFHLAPLRRVDIELAARGFGVDPGPFLDGVHQGDLESLATRPLTLNLLLETVRDGRALTADRVTLFQRGCHLLASEHNDRRFDTQAEGTLETSERLKIASRLAAVSILTNRGSFSVRHRSSGSDSAALAPSELVALLPRDGNREQLLKEVLATGLFAGSAAGTVVWAHRSYAELLAATALNSPDIAPEEVVSLLQNPSDAEGGVVPELAGLTAWLITLRPELLRPIADIDPLVVLGAELAALPEADRAYVVDQLLERIEDRRLPDLDWGHEHRLAQLGFPGLGDVLREVIDGARLDLTKRAAIRIAAACKVSDLQELLLETALSSTAPNALRIASTRALAIVGDSEACGQLRPLLYLPLEEDPDDEIKGYALEAMWPGSLTVRELFEALTPPRRGNLYGAYRHFLRTLAVTALDEDGVSVAVAWVLSRPERRPLDDQQLHRIEDAVMLRALTVGVEIDTVARVFTNRIAAYEDPIGRESVAQLGSLLDGNQALRRRLLLAVFRHVPDGRIVWSMWHGLRSLFGTQDALWLVEALEVGEVYEPARVSAWQLIRSVVDPDSDNEALLQAIVDATSRDERMSREAATELLGPIDMESPTALALRDQYRLTNEYEAKREAEQAEREMSPPFDRKAAVLDRLGAFEQAGGDACWHAIHWVLADDHRVARWGPAGGIAGAPGWLDLDEADQLRVLAAGLGLLSDPSRAPGPTSLGKSMPWSGIAGYETLRFISQRDQGELEAVPMDVLERWAPFVLTLSRSGTGPFDDADARLIRHLWQRVPEVAFQACDNRLREEAEASARCDTEVIEEAWAFGGRRLAETILDDVEVGAEAASQVLAAAIRQSDQELIAMAWGQLAPDSGTAPERRAWLGAVLMASGIDGAVAGVLDAVAGERDVERNVLAIFAEQRSRETLASCSAEEFTRLLLAYCQHWPPASDPELGGIEARAMTTADSARAMRSYVLNALVGYGTPVAVAGLERSRAELEGGEFLDYAVQEARQTVRSQTWAPLEASEVVALLTQRGAALVRSPQDLLRVIRESLSRLQRELLGPTQAVEDLWNTADRRYLPKKEVEVSNYIKRHLERDLRRDGFVINREVEVRQSHGGGDGQRTDILVQVARRVSPGGDLDVLTAIVEVKPSWNDGLLVAMREQLVERYLRDEGGHAGLYLVPKFFCDQWDREDGRRSVSKRRESDEVATELARQARGLSQEAGLPVEFVGLDCVLR